MQSIEGGRRRWERPSQSTRGDTSDLRRGGLIDGASVLALRICKLTNGRYHFAKEHGVIFLDEYDSLHANLELYWAIPPHSAIISRLAYNEH